MTNLTVEESLLELAADDDAEGFARAVERDASLIDRPGSWFSRRRGSNQAVLLQRTPLMVAATYGSVRVLEFLLSHPTVDVGCVAAQDGATALHCAASGGAPNAAAAVRALLAAGADSNVLDSDGNRPVDVIASPPNAPDRRIELLELLGGLRVSTSSSSSSPPLSASPDGDAGGSPSSNSTSSPIAGKFPEKREYPLDPSLPDIKNSIYSTDEFRMFSFKVRPCSRAYSHDWTECPFVHPGENARRRDPRKFHYSCVPCPDFRKGACRRGDLCEYAHGVFECWLHPAQYRTRLCKDGSACNRRVCFFAHTSEELRPLFVSTGSAVPSPRAAAMEMALNMMPGSPTSAVSSPFTPPLSPNGIGHGPAGVPWPQPAVPVLHLSGSNLSRLRTSINARDLPVEELSMLQQELETQQLLADYSGFSPIQARLGSLTANGSARCRAIAPSNLDELFAPEISSPRFNSEQTMFSPTHKNAVLQQFHQQQQSLLSPIKTNNVFSPSVTLGLASPAGLSPRGMEPVSPMNSRLVAAAALSQREKQLQQYQQMRSLSSRELGLGSVGGTGSPVGSPWAARWGSPAGKLEWGMNEEETGRLRRSNSFETSGGEEPDVSWVQSLVKESPSELKERADVTDQTVLSAWLDQMQIDQAAAS